MNGCESRTLKKAECQRVDSFELWCSRWLLKVPWTAREIKPVNPKGKKSMNIHWKNLFRSLSSNILHHLMWRVNSLGKTWCWERLKAKGEEGSWRWDGWITSLIQWTWTWANTGRLWGTGRLGVLGSMGLQRVRHNLVSEQQQHKGEESEKYMYIYTYIYIPLCCPLETNTPHCNKNSYCQLTNIWEKKRSKRQRRKAKIFSLLMQSPRE